MVLLHEQYLRRFLETWQTAVEAQVNLPPSADPAYSSLGTLGRHVLSAAGGYLIWICAQLQLEVPEIRPAPNSADFLRDAAGHMEHVLDQWQGSSLRQIPDSQLETPEYPSEWQTRYSIDSMLEHAVMHPIRHTFQLDELISQARRA